MTDARAHDGTHFCVSATDRIRELEAALRAIAVHDWETLRRIGGDVWERGDLYSTPADFDLEGDFESDARHVFPARHRAIVQAARAALEGGNGDEPRGVVCHLCGTGHPGDLVCRTSVASFMCEEASKMARTESSDYMRGYNDALLEYADMIGGSDG